VVTVPTLFLVVDETECAKTDVFALVGVLVPIEKVDTIRLDLNRFVRDLQAVPDDTVLPAPELHGSKMLLEENEAWATDDHRVRCYEKVVELVNEHRLRVLRVAYFKRSVARIAEGDRKHHGLCYAGLSMSLSSTLEHAYVLPVMDGLDQRVAGKLGQQSQSTGALRAMPGFAAESLSIENAERLMDPVFVDSRFSPLMQLTDVTAYLLHLLDCERTGHSFTMYKSRLLAIAKGLDLSLVSGVEPIEMKWTRTRAE
jgi:hypothetical protein